MTKPTRNPLSDLKKSLTRNLLIGIVVLFLTFIITVFFLQNAYLQTRAAPQVVINTGALTARSQIENNSKIARFVIESKRGQNLFQTPNRDISTVLGALDRGIRYQNEDSNKVSNLLPESVVQNTRLARSVDDTKGSYLKDHGFHLTDRHLIFTQQLQNIPVLGSSLSMHMASDNSVYQMSANMTADETVPQAQISDEDAKKIALDEAKKDVLAPSSLEVRSANRTIVNKKLLGLSSDANNYLALGVNITSGGNKVTFAKRYYVDLSRGTLLHQEPLQAEALDRHMYDCSTDPSNCPLVRQEGQGPVNKGDIDRAYDLFGQIFTLWKTTFNRDSYDNQGKFLQILVNSNVVGNAPCPNAAWFMAPIRQFVFCRGMVLGDIAGHEFTHAVVELTAGLPVTGQSGALNEALADVFGHTFTPENWTIGEGSPIGILRYMDDPTRSPAPNGPQPDRMFSQNYYCGVNQSAYTHINNGVINKAFYLMVDGGNFNGCQIGGQGLDKVVPVFYRALSVYLTPTSNYGAMYDAMNRACTDLYSESSTTCITVKSAMQAVEMDQQTFTSQLGAKCENVAPKAPACQQVVASPTPPTSSSPTPTPSSQVTPSANNLATGTYTDLIWPATNDGYDSFEHVVKPEVDPGQDYGYFWAHQFGLIGGDGGYLGLQTKGPRPDGTTGKVAIFSIWKAIFAEGPGFARPFGGEGEGYQTIIPFEWTAGRNYRLRVEFGGTNVRGDQWAAWVRDESTQQEELIGTITVPADWGKLADFSILWTERYSGPSIVTCNDVGYSKVLFTDPTANSGSIVPLSHNNHLASPVHCPNSKITDIQGGVRQEIGIQNEEVPTPSPTGTTQTLSPTPSSNAGSMTLNLSIRLQGITKSPQVQQNSLPVKVTVAGGGLSAPVSKTVKFSSDDQGVWHAPVSFTNISPGAGYRILIKGPKHLQQKVCDTFPSEASEGSYHCGEGKIVLTSGPNQLDFSRIYQMSGDLPIQGQQDGLINSLDLVTIVNLIGKRDADSIVIADVNLDGIVDSQDFSLVIATLSQKFDDE